MDIKKIIKDNTVFFEYYKDGFFYYSVNVGREKYIFSVDRDDIGNATLKKQDKAIFFMRYIRLAMESNTLLKEHRETIHD